VRQKVFEPKDVSSRMSEVAPDALRGLIQFGRMPYLGRVVSVLLLWCCVIVVLINLRFFRKKHYYDDENKVPMYKLEKKNTRLQIERKAQYKRTDTYIYEPKNGLYIMM